MEIYSFVQFRKKSGLSHKLHNFYLCSFDKTLNFLFFLHIHFNLSNTPGIAGATFHNKENSCK
jgi:hypothetical protein